MAVINTSLGWKCDEAFLISDADRKLASIGVSSPVTKKNSGDAIGCQIILSNGDMGPVLISTVEDNVIINGYSSSTVYTITIFGKVWYIQQPETWDSNGTYYIPSLTLSYCNDINAYLSSDSNRARIVRDILTASMYESPRDARYTVLNPNIPSISADSSYVVSSPNRILSTHSGSFQKIYDGNAIAIEYKYNDTYAPLLISNISENCVKFTNNETTVYTIIISGITWYMSTSEYRNNVPDPDRSIPIYEGNYDITTSEGRLNLLNYMISHITINKELTDIPSIAYFKSYTKALFKANNQRIRQLIHDDMQSLVFIGPADEFESAKLAGTVNANTVAIITDRDSYDITELVDKLDEILDQLNNG